MKKKSSVLSKIKKVFMLLTVLCMMQSAVIPTQVYATDKVMDIPLWITKIIGFIKEIYGWLAIKAALIFQTESLITYYGVLDEQFLELIDKINEESAYKIGSFSVYSKVLRETTKQIIDGSAKDSINNAILKNSMSHITTRNNFYLCRNVIAHQLPLRGEMDMKATSNMIVGMVSSRYRCKTCDGNGPDYAVWESAARLGKNSPSSEKSDNIAKFANSIDGYDSKFVPNEKSLVDADLLGNMESMNISMPTIIGGDNDKTYKPKTKEEAAFMAGVNYLVHIAGARVTPLRDKNINTPNGMIQRAMFNHCAANENTLTKSCADKLALYTRPNCKQNPKLCTEQNKVCEKLSIEYIGLSVFDNCEHGLSPYEEALAEQLMCKSYNYYVHKEVAGSSFDNQVSSVDLCAASWDAFEELVEAISANCTASVAAMDSMKSCWSGVNAVGGASYAQLKDKLKKRQASMPYFDIIKQPKAININMPKGQIISADKIKWPKSVWQ